MMARSLRSMVACLVVLLVPFQAITAMYLDIRGPLHFHVAIADADDDPQHHGHAHAHPQQHAHPHLHAHAHGHAHDARHLERHHHDPNDASVVTIGGGLLDPAALKGENPSGWSSVMLVAIVGDEPSLESSELSN